MLKAAVVGLGWWGKEIINRLERSDRIDVVVGVDPDLDAVKDFAAAKGLPLTASYDEIISRADVDAVILATPHALHEEQVLAAAASKQIFCEKPLALTAAAAQRMLSACDDNGIVLGIGHERRYEPAFEEMKRRVDDGELGTLLHIEINASYNLFAGNPRSGWRQDPKQAPAGMLTALGVHLTDYMQTVAGPVTEVYARLSHRSRDYPSEDILSVQIAFESGVTGYLCNIATTPFHQRISVFGDRGWVETREVSNVDQPDPAVMTWRGMDQEIHTRTYAPTDTVLANLHDWADAVEGRGTYRFTRRQKLHNIEILEAIVQSAASGRPQPVG
jgi:predicted dehydrogenase